MTLHPALACTLLAPAALVAAAASQPDITAQELDALHALYSSAFEAELAPLDHPDARRTMENLRDEYLGTIEHFRRTGDARYASPTRHVTLLHLACLARNPGLVQRLLAAGADPNATIYLPELEKDYDGVFTLALCGKYLEGLPECERDSSLRLVDMLVAAGADAKGRQAGSALFMLALVFGDFEGAEDVALRLLEHGADPANNSFNEPAPPDEDDCDQPPRLEPKQAKLCEFLSLTSRRGWVRVVERVLRSGQLADIDARVDGHQTVLGALVRHLAEMQHDKSCAEEYERQFEGCARCVSLLLHAGASPAAPEDDRGEGATVADFIHSNPRLLAWLTEQGHDIPRTPRELRAESLLQDLRQLPEAACPPRDTLAPLHDALAALLGRDDAAAVQGRVMRLLMQLNEARTGEFIRQLPLWRGERAWTDSEQEFFAALHAAPGLTRALPADWLAATARQLDAAGRQREAHGTVLLLAHKDEAVPLLAALCDSPRPALASAAWTARLRLAGLDNLPLLNEQQLCDRNSEDCRRLRLLRHGLERLTDLDFCGPAARQNFFLDFSAVDGYLSMSSAFLELKLPRLSAEESMGALLGFLRERGARAEANYLGELYQLHRRLHPNESDSELVNFTRSLLSEVGKEKREARFAELTRPERLDPVAYRVETLLGRYLWEIYTRNRK